MDKITGFLFRIMVTLGFNKTNKMEIKTEHQALNNALVPYYYHITLHQLLYLAIYHS